MDHEPINDMRIERDRLGPSACLNEAWSLLSSGQGVYWPCVLAFFVYLVVASFVPFGGLLFGPFVGGMYIACFRAMDRQSSEVSVAFEGFSQFGPLILCNLLQSALSLIVVLPAYCTVIGAAVGISKTADSGSSEAEAAIGIGVIAAIVAMGLVLLLIQVFTVFAYPLVVDRKLGPWEAIVWSAKGVKANFWSVLGLELLCGLIGLVAIFLCCLPIVFAFPLIIAAQAVAAGQVFPRAGITEVFD